MGKRKVENAEWKTFLCDRRTVFANSSHYAFISIRVLTNNCCKTKINEKRTAVFKTA
jgi:hypothetical protein